jgi:hypothetical protein
MNIKIVNPYNFDLDLELKETERQGKEIFEFQNSELDPFHIIIDGTPYFPDRHYLSDLSSIPKLLTIIKGMERYRWKRSAVIHDQLYRLGYLYRRDGVKVLFDREEADNIYRLLIVEEGRITDQVSLARIISPIQWLGLRIGGWFSFRRGE